jgi:transposase
MTDYKNFIGIDIGKFSFVVNKHGSKHVKEYENTDAGIVKFLNNYQETISNEPLFILETTGGYEMNLLLTLCNQKYAVHRANTRKVKNFIRSYGHAAKTDALDAKALALYGHERSSELKLYQPLADNRMALYELVIRRQELKKMLVVEKNRLQAPRTLLTKKSCLALIKTIEGELEEISKSVNNLIKEDAELIRKKSVLKLIPGIGDIISNDLLALLPELGNLNRREIASLVGLAPRANDSGKYRGYRSTGHGRNGIKPMLFLAAMAARNSNSSLKAYYEQLIGRGKKKMVALTALMRKILVIANAKIRDLNRGIKTVAI